MLKFLAPLCLLIACSCASTVKPAPANVPAMPEQKVAVSQINPLTSNAPAFRVLKKSFYTLSVPYDFINLESPDIHTDLDFNYASPDKNMQVSIASDQPSDVDLDTYAIGFVKVMVDGGQKFLEAKEGHLANLPARLVMMGMADQNGNPKVLSFYFVLLDNQKRPFVMACSIDGSALREWAPVCFTIAKSVKIDSASDHSM